MLNLPAGFAEDLSALLWRRWLVVGVGNPMRGDDGFGPLLARRLRSLGLPAVDVGSAPESFTGPILAAAPDHLIIADAADLGEEVGAVRLVAPSRAGGGGASTHDPGLALLLDHLCHRRTMSATILAVQPGPSDLGRPMSAEVRAAIDELLELFARYRGPLQHQAGSAMGRAAGGLKGHFARLPWIRRPREVTVPTGRRGTSRPP